MVFSDVFVLMNSRTCVLISLSSHILVSLCLRFDIWVILLREPKKLKVCFVIVIFIMRSTFGSIISNLRINLGDWIKVWFHRYLGS